MRFLLCLAMLTSAAAAPPQPKAPPAPADETAPADKPGQALRKRLEKLLAAGKVEDALKVAGETVFAKGTAGERQEFVDLHLSLARHLFRIEDYRRGEELARKVLTVDDRQADALELLRRLEEGRAAAPAMIERAGQFASVERWGPATRIYRKAISLLPERERDLKAKLLECHREAADQHYRLADWPEAYQHYEFAADSLDDDRKLRRVHATIFHVAGLMRAGKLTEQGLADLIAGAVESLKSRPDRTLGVMLAGLNAENAGRFDEAAALYGAVTGAGRAAGQATAAEAAKRRVAALAEIRKLLVPLGPETRPRMWQESLPGEWLIRETDRFIVHHHNDRVARRITDALEFHFVEILNDWELPFDKMVKWRPKLNVYVYRDAKEFHEQTGIEAFVPAFGKKPRPGAKLTNHSIHCYQNHPGLLSSILAHELTHMMLAYAMDYPAMATGVDEGLALLSEPDYMRTFYRRAAVERSARDGVPTLERMLADPKISDGGQATVLYANSFVMMEYLRARLPPTKLLEIVAKLPTGDPRALIASGLGLKDAGELEADWKRSWKP